jgi:opacity protein-like surface antigen
MNRKLRLLAVVLLLVISGIGADQAEAREPISFEGIIRLPEFGLSSQQIADQITESGLSFEVTSEQIDSLRKLGFDSAVINAVKQFYRMGILRITTNPAEVNLILDNEIQAITDRFGVWEKEIPRGIHSVTLQKKGYGDIDTSVTVAKDKTVDLKVSLPRIAAAAGPSKFWGRYGFSFGYGFSVTSPAFDDDTDWKSGNNIIITLKGNVLPYLFVDADVNFANFSKFNAGGGEDFGSLNAFNISVVPGLYYEFNENVRGYLGTGVEFSSTKIENGDFVDDGVAFVPDEKGSKSTFALLGKLGADALVQENVFLFAEYRAYSVLGQYSMGFITIGAGLYIK